MDGARRRLVLTTEPLGSKHFPLSSPLCEKKKLTEGAALLGMTEATAIAWFHELSGGAFHGEVR